MSALDHVLRRLPLPSLNTRRLARVVVLRGDHDAGIGGLEPGDDIAPAHVVVDAEGRDEGLAIVLGHEAQGAAGARAAHGENVLVLVLDPVGAVGEVPAGLLDAAEEGVGFGLVDGDGDGVVGRHSAEREK